MSENASMVTRREALRILAILGVSGAAAAELLAQSPEVTPEILRTASALLDQNFSQERLEVITPALRRNLIQYQMLRELRIDDRVEPAPIFVAKWS